MKQSAGLLLYKFLEGEPVFFLVHPGGPFWKKKDNGAWSIPKGELNENEDTFATAKREFFEETGSEIEGNFIELNAVKQKSGKIVYAWAIEHDIDPTTIQSNLFEIEFPPKSGKIKSFPEIDKAGWFNFSIAAEKIIPAQLPLVEQLTMLLGKNK